MIFFPVFFQLQFQRERRKQQAKKKSRMHSNASQRKTNTTVTEREIDREFQTEIATKPSGHWLKMFSGDPMSSLASLSSCYLNLEKGCDFHRNERSRAYIADWKRPAPTWCQTKRQAYEEQPPVQRDRLGVPLSVYRNCAALAQK